jgi:hypothetical protein
MIDSGDTQVSPASEGVRMQSNPTSGSRTEKISVSSHSVTLATTGSVIKVARRADEPEADS